jgi:hypothetical protein
MKNPENRVRLKRNTKRNPQKGELRMKQSKGKKGEEELP